MESAGGDGSDRSNGIILGCWDHQNTASLIKELEETVETAEKKCIILIQELMNYKKHYEEHSCKGNHVVAVHLKKKKLKKHEVINSISDNGLSQKSCVIDEDRIFYEKLRNKILEVNDEITYANLKMGVKDTKFLFPTDEFKENLKISAEQSNEKNLSPVISLDSLKFDNLCNNQFKSTKSDPVLGEDDKNELLKKYDYSKITKGELELYQSLSNKNIKIDSDFQVDDESDSSMIKSPQKFRSKSLPQHCTMAQMNKAQPSTSEQLYNKDDEIEKYDLKSKDSKKNCEIVIHNNRNSKKEKNLKKRNSKNFIPFTVCSSTSKSFNVGVNVQRCMSLIKEKKIKPSTSATIDITVPDKCMQAISNLLEAASKSKEVLSLKKNAKQTVFNDDSYFKFTKAMDLMFEGVNLNDLKESGQSNQQINSQSELRKQRFKYTTAGKGKNEKACCRKEKKTIGCKNLGHGDNSNSFKEELKTELTTIHDDFINLYRKYSLLREQISKNLLSKSEINAELDVRAIEYADLINHYGQLISSKQNYKYENFESSQPEIVIPPTSTVTLTKVLRQIQNLQEKIKQI